MFEKPSLLKVIFDKIKTSYPSRGEINYIIETSFQISISFLKSKLKNKIIFIRDDENDIEDIAMNAIVPLFTNNSEGKIGISRSIEKWNDALETESDCMYFLSRVIWRRVDQTIINIIKERDPIFEKILKTLNVCINNTELRKIRYFGTVLVLENRNSEVTKQVIDESAFNLLPENLFSYKQSELFRKIFEYIKINTDYYPAIPLNLLIKRIKSYYFSNKMEIAEITENSFNELSLTDIVEDSLKVVREKIDICYVLKNKLSSDDAENIYAALNNISKDMLNGGMHDSLYNYLKDFDKSLTREIFYTKYHHIMNYLLTLLKNNIVENIYS